ncbi:MAG TPA: DUF4232 domain-containing protein [Chloroflexota bacterium]|nr:DUF4232 domain-containing protein [Chloroflexota bacterium]
MNAKRTTIVAITLVGACGGFLAARGVTPTAASSAQQTLPRCQNIQLAITPYSSNGAAGHVGVIYRIHRTWGSTCFLKGFPGMELLDRNFGSLPNPVHWGGGVVVGNQTPRRVVLDATHDAYFAAGYGDVPVTGGTCGQAYYVMIIPPYDYLPDVTYIASNRGRLEVCGAFNASPVQATTPSP